MHHWDRSTSTNHKWVWNPDSFSSASLRDYTSTSPRCSTWRSAVAGSSVKEWSPLLLGPSSPRRKPLVQLERLLLRNSCPTCYIDVHLSKVTTSSGGFSTVDAKHQFFFNHFFIIIVNFNSASCCRLLWLPVIKTNVCNHAVVSAEQAHSSEATTFLPFPPQPLTHRHHLFLVAACGVDAR